MHAYICMKATICTNSYLYKNPFVMKEQFVCGWEALPENICLANTFLKNTSDRLGFIKSIFVKLAAMLR